MTLGDPRLAPQSPVAESTVHSTKRPLWLPAEANETSGTWRIADAVIPATGSDPTMAQVGIKDWYGGLLKRRLIPPPPAATFGEAPVPLLDSFQTSSLSLHAVKYGVPVRLPVGNSVPPTAVTPG